jgi:hypothetical protein
VTDSARLGDPSWSRYPDTVLEIYRDGVIAVDLRRSLTDSERGRLASLGLGEAFAVVTAANPRGRTLSDSDNHERAERLDTEVAQRGLLFLRADGVSPDRSHRETGVAVAAPLDVAVALAARYEQSALFWFDGRRFWIVPVLETGRGPVALPAEGGEDSA